jgi:hypothetical protein
MPTLSAPQARVLAYWSYGMVLAQSCGLTTVAVVVGLLLHTSPLTLRQQLREWCYAAADKKGPKRREVAVAPCFAALLRWVLAWWPAAERRLVVAMDATTLGARFSVLVLSVVYRGCALPVAWVVVPTTQQGSWRPHGEGLFTLLQDSVPADWTVLVLADRGLYARWLYRHIVAVGWHPFLRIKQGSHFRPLGSAAFRPLHTVVPQVGTHWCGVIDCFVKPSCRLRCTLLACWSAPHAEPWLVLTDLPPEVAQVAWYGMRTWIENRQPHYPHTQQQGGVRVPSSVSSLGSIVALRTRPVLAGCAAGGGASARMRAKKVAARVCSRAWVSAGERPT